MGLNGSRIQNDGNEKVGHVARPSSLRFFVQQGSIELYGDFPWWIWFFFLVGGEVDFYWFALSIASFLYLKNINAGSIGRDFKWWPKIRYLKKEDISIKKKSRRSIRKARTNKGASLTKSRQCYKISEKFMVSAGYQWSMIIALIFFHIWCLSLGFLRNVW